jgi:hypothetical protein
MIAECIDCYPTDLGIFTAAVVARNHSLNLVAQGLVESALTGNRGTARSFGATACFKDFAATLRTHSSQLGGTLALSQRSAVPSLERFQQRSLFPGVFNATFSARQMGRRARLPAASRVPCGQAFTTIIGATISCRKFFASFSTRGAAPRIFPAGVVFVTPLGAVCNLKWNN